MPAAGAARRGGSERERLELLRSAMPAHPVSSAALVFSRTGSQLLAL